MRMLHRHRWVAAGTLTYLPPRPFELGGFAFASPGPEYEHCIYGVTTIPQRCSECGERRTIYRTGDHREQAS